MCFRMGEAMNKKEMFCLYLWLSKDFIILEKKWEIFALGIFPVTLTNFIKSNCETIRPALKGILIQMQKFNGIFVLM